VENFYDICLQNFVTNLLVKEFCRLVYVCRSYVQKSSVLFFILTHSVCMFVCVCMHIFADISVSS